MPLTPQQLIGLNAAAARRASGTANQTDLNNLSYAERTFGYQYQPQTQPQTQIQSQPVYQQPQQNYLQSAYQMPTAPTFDPSLQSLQQNYLSAYNTLGTATAQSQEEIDLQKRLADLAASKELGLASASEATVPMGDIVGRQASIERRAALQALPLQAQLTAKQAQRQAALDTAKIQAEKAGKAYEVGMADITAQREAYNKQLEAYYKRLEPFNIGEGQSVMQYNPQTGQYEQVAYGGDKPAGTQVVSVGGRQKLINTQTGQVISDLGMVTRAPGAGRNVDTGFYGGAPDKFWTDAADGLNALKKGTPWGLVWNKLKAKYPDVSNEIIDSSLQKETWSKAGAFESYKASGKRQTASNIDQQTLNDLNDDIDNNASLADLYAAYPEVSPSLIQSLYHNR